MANKYQVKTLNDFHLKFIDEYMKDLDGPAAIVRTGYTNKSPANVACRLLSYDKVQVEIAKRRQEMVKRNDISRDDVLRELKHLAFSDYRKFFDDKGQLLEPQKLPKEVASAIMSIEVTELFNGRTKIGQVRKVRMWDKVRALELIAKILGFMSPQQKQISFDETFMSFLKKTSSASIQIEDIPFEEQQDKEQSDPEKRAIPAG